MAEKSEEARARAETKFKQQGQRSREAEEARADSAAKARAVDEKTARLKAQRLAREVELVIADSRSSDGSAQLARAFGATVFAVDRFSREIGECGGEEAARAQMIDGVP